MIESIDTEQATNDRQKLFIFDKFTSVDGDLSGENSIELIEFIS